MLNPGVCLSGLTIRLDDKVHACGVIHQSQSAAAIGPAQIVTWLALLVILAARPAAAKEHPVPLDKNAPSSQCIECHEDKTEGKAVHSAIATGCLSCHEIRTSKIATHVKLITTTSVKLCVSCHADKDAVQAKGPVHGPAVRDCLKCHDPHVSDNKNQLLKPTLGETADENLCLSCHRQGMNVPKDGSRHAALDMGCETCHVTHKMGERGKREFDYHLTKDAPTLCLDCHDGKDASLGKAHSDQPFATSDCLVCHDPHQSRSPKLARAFQHAPYAAQACDTCHAPAKDGKVVLTKASAKELCLSCHDDKAKLIESAKVQHPGAAGDCIDCHNPHTSKWFGLPKTSPVQICLGCHSDQAEQGKKAHVHQPAFVDGCGTCHQAHGGENEHLLRAKTVNGLCLECHGPSPQVQKLEAEHLVAIFDGKVKLPGKYFLGVPTLPLEYGAGHPVDRHPISDVKDPKDPSKVLTPISCLTCHQPHSSTQPGMLVKDQANDLAFCGACHKDLTKKEGP
jgi:predicted CXXCH cytochrome family protein